MKKEIDCKKYGYVNRAIPIYDPNHIVSKNSQPSKLEQSSESEHPFNEWGKAPLPFP